MKVTFKNVEQGDTIILEWLDNGIPKLGIIDCRKVNTINPVIEHLKQIEWQHDIEFIILSHSHYDHFSGMLDLLDYCDEKQIDINLFVHSLIVDPHYLNWSNPTPEGVSELRKLINKVIQFRRKQRVKEIDILSSKNWSYSFGKYQLRGLSPTDDELRRYIKDVNILSERKQHRKASKAANLLSTLLMLECNNQYALFTSDVTLDALDRVSKINTLRDKELVLTQVPHHGSRKNHRIKFWRNLKYEVNTPAVISAGLRYRHPHLVVVEDFDKNNFMICSTNNINGMADFINQISQDASDKLEMINSKIYEMYNSDGDRVFEPFEG